MIQIYTGNGKGKTTLALGLALRALGHGQRVFLVQFLKKGSYLGEVRAARCFKNFKLLQAGRPGWVNTRKPKASDKRLAEKGLRAAEKALSDPKCNLVILDELNLALKFGLLKLKEVKRILENRRKKIEVVITGRSAPAELVKLADLVSQIKEIKHYYKKGCRARCGIEY